MSKHKPYHHCITLIFIRHNFDFFLPWHSVTVALESWLHLFAFSSSLPALSIVPEEVVIVVMMNWRLLKSLVRESKSNNEHGGEKGGGGKHFASWGHSGLPGGGLRLSGKIFRVTFLLFFFLPYMPNDQEKAFKHLGGTLFLCRKHGINEAEPSYLQGSWKSSDLI